jgi:hypothetical protein
LLLVLFQQLVRPAAAAAAFCTEPVIVNTVILLLLLLLLQVFDADLLAAAVDLSHSLDARFGKPIKRMISLVSAYTTVRPFVWCCSFLTFIPCCLQLSWHNHMPTPRFPHNIWLKQFFPVLHCCCELQRDVPGLTRASIPVLASRGVRSITGGVNAFSAPPGVPKNTPFVWRDEESGSELLAMWHPGKYDVGLHYITLNAPPNKEWEPH